MRQFSKYLLFLLLPSEDAFPLLVLLVPCFSEAAREQHCFGLLAELKICSASDLVFSSSPSSQHNSSLDTVDTVDTGNIYKLAKLRRNLIPLQSLSLELYSALDPVISAS